MMTLRNVLDLKLDWFIILFDRLLSNMHLYVIFKEMKKMNRGVILFLTADKDWLTRQTCEDV